MICYLVGAVLLFQSNFTSELRINRGQNSFSAKQVPVEIADLNRFQKKFTFSNGDILKSNDNQVLRMATGSITPKWVVTVPSDLDIIGFSDQYFAVAQRKLVGNEMVGGDILLYDSKTGDPVWRYCLKEIPFDRRWLQGYRDKDFGSAEFNAEPDSITQGDRTRGKPMKLGPSGELEFITYRWEHKDNLPEIVEHTWRLGPGYAPGLTPDGMLKAESVATYCHQRPNDKYDSQRKDLKTYKFALICSDLTNLKNLVEKLKSATDGTGKNLPYIDESNFQYEDLFDKQLAPEDVIDLLKTKLKRGTAEFTKAFNAATSGALLMASPTVSNSFTPNTAYLVRRAVTDETVSARQTRIVNAVYLLDQMGSDLAVFQL